MLQRMHEMLKRTSQNSEKAKREYFFNSSVKTVETNGHCTNGYVIKSGDNKGKVLRHSNNLPRNPL